MTKKWNIDNQPNNTDNAASYRAQFFKGISQRKAKKPNPLFAALFSKFDSYGTALAHFQEVSALSQILSYP